MSAHYTKNCRNDGDGGQRQKDQLSLSLVSSIWTEILGRIPF